MKNQTGVALSSGGQVTQTTLPDGRVRLTKRYETRLERDNDVPLMLEQGWTVLWMYTKPRNNSWDELVWWFVFFPIALWRSLKRLDYVTYERRS